MAVEDLSSRRRLLGCGRIYQAYFNHHRRLLWKGGETAVGFFRAAQGEAHQPAAQAEAFTLPPIILDDLERFLPETGYHVPVLVSQQGHTC